MPEKLKFFKQIVRSRGSVYKSAECYLTVLDNYIIGFCARFLPYSPEHESEILWEADTLKLYKEVRSVEEVLSFIEGRNPDIFGKLSIWGGTGWLAHEIIELKKGDSTPFREHSYLFYQYYTHSDFSVQTDNFLKQQGEFAEMPGFESDTPPSLNKRILGKYVTGLQEAFKKCGIPSEYAPDISKNPGPYLILPNYVKMKRCGMDDTRLLVVLEAIDLWEGLHLKIKFDEQTELAILEEFHKLDNSEAKAPFTPSTLYKKYFDVPECDKVEIKILDENAGQHGEIFSCSVNPKFGEKYVELESKYKRRNLWSNKIRSLAEYHPLGFLASLITLLIFLIGAPYYYFIDRSPPTISEILEVSSNILLSTLLIWLIFLGYRKDKRTTDKLIAIYTCKYLDLLKCRFQTILRAVKENNLNQETVRFVNYVEEPSTYISNFIQSEAANSILSWRDSFSIIHRYTISLNEKDRTKTKERLKNWINEIEKDISRLVRTYEIREEETHIE